MLSVAAIFSSYQVRLMTKAIDSWLQASIFGNKPVHYNVSFYWRLFTSFLSNPHLPKLNLENLRVIFVLLILMLILLFWLFIFATRSSGNSLEDTKLRKIVAKD